MTRGLTSWVAAVLLLVATSTLPWTWAEGGSFGRTFLANGGTYVVWADSPQFGWTSVVFILVAIGFVARIPRWSVATLAAAGAVTCLVESEGRVSGGLVLSLAALALGVAAAFVPRPARRPWVVPVLAGVVLLAVALAPTFVVTDALPSETLLELLRLALFEPWAATVLIAAAAIVALTPVLPGGRGRALVPIAAGAAITAAVLAGDATLDGWNGFPAVAVALAVASLALAR